VTCMVIVDNERTLPRREGKEGLTVASRTQEPWVPQLGNFLTNES
jgi:hypothetical protein